MEDVFRETLKQAPALAVLAYLTFLFLKHLAVRDSSLVVLLESHAKAAESITVILSGNTKAMAENTRALDEMRRSLHSASSKIEEGLKTNSDSGKLKT